ncbi:hypothetical protein QUA27_26205 [Microcoleus sp. Pol14C6]|uniref:hypothetical protein n=1 Tax=unclassified Microcoleus TaxID=2642155 RepID=UPI002FD1361F
MKSSTREGGFCLCSRGFNRRGFWVSTAGFFVDGRSNLREMCDRVFGFIGAIGFFVDGAIEFERNVRSGFWVYWAIEFERNVRSGFWVYWAIGFLGLLGDRF